MIRCIAASFVLSAVAAAPDGSSATHWDEVADLLQGELAYLGPAGLLVGDDEMVMANITIGDWDWQRPVPPVWSASKIVNGAVFWALDAEGVLPVDSLVSDHLEWWTTDPADARSRVTVRHLLDFTSGFVHDPSFCWISGSSFDSCSRTLYGTGFDNASFGVAVYAETHLHLAQSVAPRRHQRG